MAAKGLLLVVGVLSVSKFIDGYVETLGSSIDMPQPRSEPQVAILCNQAFDYQNQYMDSTGRWVTDLEDTRGCLENKEDILDYCKKMYPNKNITNIVESTHSYVVDDWCKVGHGKCAETHLVKPYRCLEGKFQSDALLVPEPCQFDHIHNASWCWDFNKWNITADKACEDRAMRLRSFAMLLPCGTDIFTGVEFVCCPRPGPTTEAPHPIEARYPPQLTSEINIDAEEITLEPGTEAETPATRDPYFTRFDPRIEHEAFRDAERRLEASHQREIKRILQKWTELEEKYQTIKASSPSEADKFKLRMTEHFQKRMTQLKSQGAAKKQQLVSLHQQRIVAHINERKKDARSCFVRALNESPPESNSVHKCLSRLVRALYKDRHHTISHFRHLLSSDAVAARAQRLTTAQHLHDVDLMVNDSIQMLDRFPTLKLKILPELSQTVAELRRQDSVPAELTEIPHQDSIEDDEIIDDDSDEDIDDDDDDDEDDDENDDEDDEQDALLDDQPKLDVSSADLHRVEEELVPQSISRFDPETMEDDAVATTAPQREAVAERHVQPLPSHAETHEHVHDEATFRVRGTGTAGGGGRGLYFTVALASIALTVALVAGVLTLRRRQRAPRNLGFVEVEQSAAPEEPHVTQMQVNGYENPTYRYFESK